MNVMIIRCFVMPVEQNLRIFVPTDQEEIVVPDRTRPTSNIHREESRTAAINTGNKGRNDNVFK